MPHQQADKTAELGHETRKVLCRPCFFVYNAPDLVKWGAARMGVQVSYMVPRLSSTTSEPSPTKDTGTCNCRFLSIKRVRKCSAFVVLELCNSQIPVG